MAATYTMPVPPAEGSQAFDYYQQFVREMNKSYETQTGIRIKQSIARAAERLNTSPAYMARVLVEYGLRAPRHVFPNEFIVHVEQQNRSTVMQHFQLSGGVSELGLFWARHETETARVLENA